MCSKNIVFILGFWVGFPHNLGFDFSVNAGKYVGIHIYLQVQRLVWERGQIQQTVLAIRGQPAASTAYSLPQWRAS